MRRITKPENTLAYTMSVPDMFSVGSRPLQSHMTLAYTMSVPDFMFSGLEATITK